VVEAQLEDKEGTVELSFDVDGALPPMLSGDVNRLWQIMVNLISNGIKFTDKGSVNVRLFAPDQSHWEIEVRDTGIGIPQGVMEFIFEPLRRAPDYATRRHPGAGLGLSITKELVSMMGGSIEVESKVGVGSLFRVRLPIIEEQ
jgi:signal transduction histidine kinase